MLSGEGLRRLWMEWMTAGSYGWLTYAQMRVALAARLDDSSNVYWTDAENGLYCLEALRTWQSLTRYWRDSFSFIAAAPTSPVESFYDITQQTGTLVPLTLKDTDLESILCYHLIEKQPSAGPTWNGTDQFTLADLTNALQRRRDQFLVETGMVLTRSLVSGIVPGVGKVPLPDATIDVRRCAWIDTLSGAWSAMWKGDEFSRQTLSPNWFTSPGTPTGFSMALQPPVNLQLLPPPLNPGQFEMLSINAGAALTGAGVLLGIPDDFTWVVKFGALADLFGKDGQARDADRAAYCEARWQEGILAARACTSVETAFLNGSQVWLSSLFDLDTISPGWQNTSGAPSQIIQAGWNLIGLSPVPDSSGPYSITLDLVQNAPIPSSDSAFIQLGREEMDAVLDYAEHLAALKMGGADFQATMRQYQNFKRLALVRNSRLAAILRSGPQPLFDKTWREERERPRRTDDIPEGIALDTASMGKGG